jgi:hypothetical protein
VLSKLVNEQGIDPSAIVALTPVAEKRSQWKSDERLGNFVLIWNMNTEMDKADRVSKIHSLKGLASAVVILTELDRRFEEISDQIIFVGLSRERHHAVVIGDLPQTLPSRFYVSDRIVERDEASTFYTRFERGQGNNHEQTHYLPSPLHRSCTLPGRRYGGAGH